MLVLERKRNEAILIDCPDGSQIEVRVTDLRGRDGTHRVKIGIHADPTYFVRRAEMPLRAAS